MLSYILDQSHWNGRCYYPTAKQAGAIASFIRYGSINAYTGVCYTDFLLEDNVLDAVTYNFPFGAYFYMRPKFNGILQGKFFVDLLKKYPPKLPAVVDVEEAGDYRNIISMLQAIRDAGFEDMIYTRQNIWDYSFPANDFWKTTKLWAARWTSADINSPWGDGRYKFRDWDDWKFWQYDANGNGRAKEFGFPGYPSGDADIDLSCYNGTLEQFMEEYKIDGGVIVPQGAYIVNVDNLNIREYPNVSAKILGQRRTNDIVVPVDYGGDNFWISDERGWSAVNYGGKVYMRKA